MIAEKNEDTCDILLNKLCHSLVFNIMMSQDEDVGRRNNQFLSQ